MEKQLKLRDELIQAYKNYDAGKVKRDTDSVKKFSAVVNEKWKEFENNHEGLSNESEVDLTHDYFVKDTLSGLKTAIDNLKEGITARLRMNQETEQTTTIGTSAEAKAEVNEARKALDNLETNRNNDIINRDKNELGKLKALYNTKIEILRVTIEKTQLEQGSGAIYLQQKIRNLEAQWKSLTTLADDILKFENSTAVLNKIMEAQEQFDNGITAIQEKARNIEQVKLPPMNIPIFGGTYGAWRNFRDSFETAVHSNTEIGNIQKMQHLKAF